MKNSNKLLSIMLVVIMVVSMLPMSVFADEPTLSWDVSVNGDNSVMAYLYADTHTLVISGIGAIKNSVADSTYGRYLAENSSYGINHIIVEEGITKIGNSAFYNNSGHNWEWVCDISLPSTLIEIGEGAFKYAGCDEIIIPKSVSIIGSGAFYNSKFRNVIFEDGSALSSVDLSIFSNTSVTRLILPEGITTITGSSIMLSLKYLEIPSTVTNYSAKISINNDLELTVVNKASFNQNVTCYNNEAFSFWNNPSAYNNNRIQVYLYRNNTNFETAVDNGLQVASTHYSEFHYIDDIAYLGTLENGVTWSYDNNTRTLSFSGDGNIPDYSNGSQPWYGAASTGGVSSYSFGSGITGIGTGVFGYYGGSGTWGSNGNYNGVSTYSQPSLASSIASLAPGASNSTGEPIFGDADNEVGNAGEDGTTYIIVDANTTIFKASVPIKITVNQIADGSVSVPGPYTIDNLCPAGPIVVTDVRLQMKTNWSIADFTDDFANKLASSPILGLQMNENNFATNGSYTMPSSVSSSILHGESKALTFNAKLPAQKTPIVNENIAAIIFTLDFDKVQ